MSSIKVNSIVENTADNGVTVDGVLLKDGGINIDSLSEKTSGSGVTIDGALIKDGLVASTAGGGLVKLAEYTFDNDADKDFDVLDSSEYFGYKIVLKDWVPATDNSQPRLGFRNDGSDVLTSVTIERAAYTMRTNSSSSLAGSASNPSGYFELSYQTGNASGEMAHSIAELYPHDTQKTWVARSIRTGNDGVEYVVNIIAMAKDDTTVDGVRVYATTGNITSGTIAIWGYKK
jgi:hypothetical protein